MDGVSIEALALAAANGHVTAPTFRILARWRRSGRYPATSARQQ